MAVNFANALSKSIVFSGLITTRKEGELKRQLLEDVDYFFLEKKSNFDFRAFLRFRKYVCVKNIAFIHAHSSSFFWAVLLKLTLFRVKIIWHDHYGNRLNDGGFKNIALCFFSFFFSHIIAVNVELRDWASKNMLTRKVVFLPNFVIDSKEKIDNDVVLKGEKDKRIIFLANLKQPKNHIVFLKAFKESGIADNGWTLHFLGKDFFDEYSGELKQFIAINKLDKNVFLYGSCNNVNEILKQGNIGVLSSTFEGFPVTLLEYGKSRLFVLTTNVGYCENIVRNNVDGLVFDPNSIIKIVNVLKEAISIDENLKNEMINRFYERCINEYGENAIIFKYLRFIQNE